MSGIVDGSIIEESRDRYLTYAMSVISGRALPDIRDGLKPVQRRILYAMFREGLLPDRKHSKSAGVVGEVLKKYHPHGDSAVYDAMVRLAQSWNLRYPLVDGQGNFGSLDGDSAAAYRYTEAKLTEFALEVIGEIDQETVAFRDNFDGTETEPVVFPSRVPNMLVNGASGIAVGMATSIPPHNLSDVIAALIELSEAPDTKETRLSTIVKGPDFPTGCQILNSRAEINEMYRTGRGSVRMRGEWKIEEGNRGKRFIIVSSIPYAVNKATLVEKIADLIIQKKVPQLVDVRDESTHEVRVVIELASDADAEVAMAYLFKHTTLESQFPVNLTVLTPGSDGALLPQTVSLKTFLEEFLKFREYVVESKLKYEKKKLEERIHILEGLMKIFDALDEAIKIVRKSEGRTDAAQKLAVRFKLTEIQAYAVVDMRIYQLSRTNIDEIRAELELKLARVAEINRILKSAEKIRAIVRQELKELDAKFGDKRKSDLIVRESGELEYNAEHYVVQEDVFAVITRDGWLKRIRQNNDLNSTRLREGDSVLDAHALNTKDFVVFFTSLGNLYVLRVTDFPSSSGYGDPIQKLLKFKDNEAVVASYAMPADKPKQRTDRMLFDNDSVVLITEQGTGFCLKVTDLAGTKRSGKRAIKLRDGDKLAAVVPTNTRYAFFVRSGSALVIEHKEIPERDTPAVGVALMGVRDEDAVVAAFSFAEHTKLHVVVDGDKEKEIETKELTAGHRALKGTKAIARGQITRLARALPTPITGDKSAEKGAGTDTKSEPSHIQASDEGEDEQSSSSKKAKPEGKKSKEAKKSKGPDERQESLIELKKVIKEKINDDDDGPVIHRKNQKKESGKGKKQTQQELFKK